jgi:hypothetical protein
MAFFSEKKFQHLAYIGIYVKLFIWDWIALTILSMDDRNPKPLGKWQVVGLAFELGYIIALPILFFALLGKYLDNLWHTDPWLKIAGVILALASSTVWLVRRFSDLRNK